MYPNEIHATVAVVRYETQGKITAESSVAVVELKLSQIILCSVLGESQKSLCVWQAVKYKVLRRF